MNPQEIVKKMVLEGSTQANIGKVLGWNQSTVSRLLKTLNISIDERGKDDWIFNCPNCNDQYVHLEDVKLSTNEYGPVVTAQLWCEACQKDMEMEVESWKGNVYVKVNGIKEKKHDV
jgi:transcription elongation factor Elf1